MAKRQSEHYVNNREFSEAVVNYVNAVKQAEAEGKEAPRIPNYIGECFMKICEGLSHKPNFIRYSYRDEMVMDAVENCVEKLTKFDRAMFEDRKAKVTDKFKDDLSSEELEKFAKDNGFTLDNVRRWYGEWLVSGDAALKPKLPNAFAYFTQIAFYAFLRRIAKEKKQWDIKMKYIETASIEAFADFGMDDMEHSGDSLIAKIRNRTDTYHKEIDPILDDEKPVKKTVSRGWGKKKAAKAPSSASVLDFE